jgi:hypothetical protein
MSGFLASMTAVVLALLINSANTISNDFGSINIDAELVVVVKGAAVRLSTG